MPTNTKNTAFFSSVRTNSKLKKQVQQVLNELGLTWGAFVNNQAKKLVEEKKVVFKTRDKVGFTSSKKKELQEAIKRAKSGVELAGPFDTEEAKKHLRSLK